MLKPILNRVFNAIIKPVIKINCFAVNFKSGSFGLFDSKVINPDGIIDIEWMSPSQTSFATSRTIVSQTQTNVAGQQEFFMFVGTNGNLITRVGGSERVTSPAIIYRENTKYRWMLDGDKVSLWVNDVLQPSMTFNRGAAREPLAQARIASTLNSFFYAGTFPWIRINNFLWPISDTYNNIQSSVPAGNNLLLINVTAEDWVQIPCNLRP